MEGQEYEYIRRVDRALKRLREHLLGLDTKFEQLLPEELKDQEVEQQAAFMADRLLFCLAVEEEMDPEELGRSRAWLYEVILFLLAEVNECDHDLASILKLFDLSLGARVCLLMEEKTAGRFRHLKTDRHAPADRETLEAAMLRLSPLVQREELYDKLNLYFVNQN